jgi:signal transduction histidine kinase
VTQAPRVNIELVATDSAVAVTIDDNGKGFDVQKALQKSDSWGLRGIRERTAVVNGELTIESEVGKGTHLQLIVPR